jgi:lipopolysaccharide/colanic/teichoic acid biosynthesis glycosyltransferase
VKRLFDVMGALVGMALSAPVMVPCALLVFLGDRRTPFYVADRVGKDDQPFRMIKLRSMVIGADRSGVDSTAAGDSRITPVGAFIRRYKLDEFAQLVNVLKGDMSVVGPRPNVQRETDLYTAVERRLLSVRPGITDLASIVFADEGEILEGTIDPDLAYNQLIRPWKSRLGLVYVEQASLGLDLKIIWLTGLALASRRRALDGVVSVLESLGVDDDLCRVASRRDILSPFPPPGADDVVRSRD